ncbi:hypothetical protein [Pseudarthrobacter humi]|nr:hypothetical protein [Pseudarthrobacter humi]
MDPLTLLPAADVHYGWICILLLVLLHEPSCRRAVQLVRACRRK